MGKNRKGPNWWALAVLVGLLALLVAAPGLLIRGLDKNVYTIREKEKAERYEGTLTLWHVVTFKTGAGSGVGWLKDRAAAFEKQHPYVFLEVEGLTAEEAESRLAAGEQPDLMSFPLGFGEGFVAETLPEREELDPALARVGEGVAWPWMGDGYVLLINRDMAEEQALSLPLSGDMSKECLLLMASKLGLSVTKTRGLLPLGALLACPYPPDDGSVPGTEEAARLGWKDIPLREGGADAFLEEEAGLYLCPKGEAARLMVDQRTNALSVEEIPLPGYTDLIQLAGMQAGMAQNKQAVCLDFLRNLLRETPQKKLADLGMTGVRRAPEGEVSPWAQTAVPGASTSRDVLEQKRTQYMGDWDREKLLDAVAPA